MATLYVFSTFGHRNVVILLRNSSILGCRKYREETIELSKAIDDLVSHIAAMSSPEFQELFTRLKELEPLRAILDSVSEPERSSVLKKITTFAEQDTKSFTMQKHNSDYFDPPLVRYDIVNCYFTGVGYEWDAKHFAVIWDVYPHLDSVMVIPTTSKTRTESKNVFSVGKIPGLNGLETTLLISDMTRVSRKRIETLSFFHPKHGNKPIRLPVAWTDQILHGIVSTYAGESTFIDFLKKKTQDTMVADLKLLKDERFKAIRGTFDKETKTLEYRYWNKDEVKKVELLSPNIPLAPETKKKLIEDLYSPLEHVRLQAEANYKNWYHNHTGT
ncbi:hypothetical protein [Paenibacillus jiagnxiensis]|uniref:hypothetical protein n=1 Tax=Paenibacillus jiagnxiensis TaxID=3228926 RepID=UPI00347D6000